MCQMVFSVLNISTLFNLRNDLISVVLLFPTCKRGVRSTRSTQPGRGQRPWLRSGIHIHTILLFGSLYSFYTVSTRRVTFCEGHGKHLPQRLFFKPHSARFSSGLCGTWSPATQLGGRQVCVCMWITRGRAPHCVERTAVL